MILPPLAVKPEHPSFSSLQRLQATSHRPRSVLRARGRHQQLQGLPRFQEQPVHLTGAGGQEPHPAPEQRAALLQRPARRHAGDLLPGVLVFDHTVWFGSRTAALMMSVNFADL